MADNPAPQLTLPKRKDRRIARGAKPVRVFWSPLTRRFFASRSYKVNGEVVTITGAKWDVTNDIAGAIAEHGITFTAEPADAR